MTYSFNLMNYTYSKLHR